MTTGPGRDRGVLPHPVTGALFTSPVPPGDGWPEDPAGVGTPVAADAGAVRALAGSAGTVAEVAARVSVCRACPRLLAWREEVARTGRRAYAGQPYWGRPVPGLGSDAPRLLVVGLAPAAHGGNRTGRIFTGDRSGDWIFAALCRAGLAEQPTSVHAGDGQRLVGTRVVAAVRCAPPQNAPSPAERDTCAPWLDQEVRLVLPAVRAVLVLGAYALAAALGSLARCGVAVPRPRPRFGHGVEVPLSGGPTVVASFHPSQQNTFTGRLTVPMLDAVVARAAELAGEGAGAPDPGAGLEPG